MANLRRIPVLLGSLAAGLTLLLGGLGAAGNYFFHYALAPVRPSDSQVLGSPGSWFADNGEVVRLNCGTESEPSWRQGSLFSQEGHRFAIVFHGYRSCGSQMEGYVREFWDMGFSVLAPDALAHGASDGDWLGMGWLERPDNLEWIQFLLKRDPEAQIVLFGISMGAATAMMLSGEDLPAAVRGIIADCGYTSVWDEFAVQLREQFGLPPFPLLYAADAVTRLRAGYSLREASSVNQLRKASVPMLFLHGEEDTFVPYAMLDEVYEACASPCKEKVSIPGAGHAASASADPQLYWGSIRQFLDRCLPAV